MVTIKDIAREAGVSCGTVSNVLNAKGNVSSEKINRVQEAIAQLGYEVNEAAKTLRMQRSRTIAVIVPSIRSRHYIEVYETICRNMQPYHFDVEIYSTDNVFSHEETRIRKMISTNVAAIVSFPTYINSAELYNKIPERIHLSIVGPKPVGITRPYLNLSFDYEQIADDIASYVQEKRYKNVALFIDCVRFSESFKACLTSQLTKAGIIITNFDSTGRTAVVRAYEALEYGTLFDAVITSNMQRAKAARQAYSTFLPEKMPEIISLSASNTVFESEYTTLSLNYNRLGTLISDSLVDVLFRHKMIATSYILKSEGLSRRQLGLPYFKQQRTLSILAVDDFCTAALPKLLSQFERKTGVHVNITYFSQSAFSYVLKKQFPRQHDVLIAGIDNLVSLSAEEMPFLTSSEAPELWSQLHSVISPSETFFPQLSDTRLCFSFNTACQMLFYRRDWFQDQSARRTFYEYYSTELRIPQNADELLHIASFFPQKYRISVDQLYGLSLSSFRADSFLPEFLSYLSLLGLSLFDANGQPNLCSPAIIRATQRYFALMRLSNVKNNKHICNSVDEFIRGSSLLSIFSTANSYLFSRNEYRQITECIACQDVPSKHPIISGNAIGILRNTEQPEEAAAFLEWIFHDTISTILTLFSGQPIKKSSAQNTEVLELYPWMKHFTRNIDSGRLFSSLSPRISTDSVFYDELLTALSNAYINQHQLEPALLDIQNSWK